MELVVLERPLVPLSVLEVLRALAVEHAVVPVALVLAVPALSIEHSPAALHSISEFPLVPASIGPPERPSSVPLPGFELTLVNVALLARPGVHSSALFLVEAELTDVVVAGGEVQLPMTFKLPVVELPVYYFVGVLEEADSPAMWPVDFGLPNVNNLRVLEKFRGVEGGLSG